MELMFFYCNQFLDQRLAKHFYCQHGSKKAPQKKSPGDNLLQGPT